MSLLLEFSMTPLDKGGSLSEFVAPAVGIVDESGIPYVTGPMGTTLEGEWDEVMAVVKKCLDGMSQHSGRISISIRADYRPGRTGRIKSKTDSVERRLQRPLSR
ncbi:MAG: MTH1187 family thiamine-binding protein [Magnetococcus sp. WYHC-3]